MAIRRASSTGTSRMPHLSEPEHTGEPNCGPFELPRDIPAGPGLGMEAPHVQHALCAVGLEVGATDDPVAGEQWQHVVAVLTLVLTLVDLDHVAKAEEPLEQ